MQTKNTHVDQDWDPQRLKQSKLPASAAVEVDVSLDASVHGEDSLDSLVLINKISFSKKWNVFIGLKWRRFHYQEIQWSCISSFDHQLQLERSGRIDE